MKTPKPGRAARALIPAAVALSCALSTGLLVRAHFNAGGALFEVPEDLLVRTVLSNSLASPFSLRLQGKPFGSAILQAGAPSADEPVWTLRLSASGRLPGAPREQSQWTLRARGFFAAQTRELERAEIEFESRTIPLALSATSDLRAGRHTARIGSGQEPGLVLSGSVDEIRAEIQKRFGWAPPAELPSAGASGLRITRGRVEPFGRPLEVFLIRERGGGALRDFLCVVSLTGQPLYLRLPGGFEALPDGVSDADLEAFKRLR